MAVKWTAKYTYLKIYRTGVEANGTLVYRVSDPYIGITCKTKKTLHSEKTEYQELAVIERNSLAECSF